jgi:hypothetical protein
MSLQLCSTNGCCGLDTTDPGVLLPADPAKALSVGGQVPGRLPRLLRHRLCHRHRARGRQYALCQLMLLDRLLLLLLCRGFHRVLDGLGRAVHCAAGRHLQAGVTELTEYHVARACPFFTSACVVMLASALTGLDVWCLPVLA